MYNDRSLSSEVLVEAFQCGRDSLIIVGQNGVRAELKVVASVFKGVRIEDVDDDVVVVCLLDGFRNVVGLVFLEVRLIELDLLTIVFDCFFNEILERIVGCACATGNVGSKLLKLLQNSGVARHEVGIFSAIVFINETNE